MKTAELLKNSFDPYHNIPLSFWELLKEAGEVTTVMR